MDPDCECGKPAVILDTWFEDHRWVTKMVCQACSQEHHKHGPAVDSFCSTNFARTMFFLPTLQPGDILLTRNELEEENRSPGYWNHSAVYVGDNTVVEAQDGPGEVIVADWEEFYNRYPRMMYLRPDPSYVDGIVAEAKNLIGQKYTKWASLFRYLRKRYDNCVSVVRKAWRAGAGEDPRWRIPDHIFEVRKTAFVSYRILKPQSLE